MSYIPASQADADLIASYLPKPHADGSPILPSELPTSLPGYLIYLKAQINLDGVAVATSATALPMGTDLQSTGGFTKLSDPTQWDLTSETSNTVGQATAIGISAGGISAVQLTQLKDRLTATKTQLEAKNFTGLSGEQISGDLLTATIWSWFASSESHSKLNQNLAGIIENPGFSYGLLHNYAKPIYSWGVIRQVKFPGVNFDIGHVRDLSWAKDNNINRWINYNKFRGLRLSSLEHEIPERFFSDSTVCNSAYSPTFKPELPACAQAISAVKAIAIATSQGQKIFTITSTIYASNPNIISDKLFAHSYSTRQAVQNALVMGHEVTIHEKPITQSGWTGAGYTTIDPSTGAGGYIIEGGANGGVLNCANESINRSISIICQYLESQAVPRPPNDLDYRNAEHFWFAYELAQVLGPLAWFAVILWELGKYARFTSSPTSTTCPTPMGFLFGMAGATMGMGVHAD